jgi:hypothetical protein
MQAVRIDEDGAIRLPKTVLRRFPRQSELLVLSEGDTIMLKRMKPLKPSDLPRELPGEEMSLEEICAEVHAYRKEKRVALKDYKGISILRPAETLAKLQLPPQSANR